MAQAQRRCRGEAHAAMDPAQNRRTGGGIARRADPARGCRGPRQGVAGADCQRGRCAGRFQRERSEALEEAVALKATLETANRNKSELDLRAADLLQRLDEAVGEAAALRTETEGLRSERADTPRACIRPIAALSVLVVETAALRARTDALERDQAKTGGSLTGFSSPAHPAAFGHRGRGLVSWHAPCAASAAFRF